MLVPLGRLNNNQSATLNPGNIMGNKMSDNVPYGLGNFKLITQIGGVDTAMTIADKNAAFVQLHPMPPPTPSFPPAPDAPEPPTNTELPASKTGATNPPTNTEFPASEKGADNPPTNADLSASKTATGAVISPTHTDFSAPRATNLREV